MLMLEQVRAVNAGFHARDLNAALRPLEETIDLRAGELPRLDKKAVAALKDGLRSGDDAVLWADAIFHDNISVRRFARKVLMGMGDEAAPLFAPLRARIERFWEEEPRLAGWENSREAARRREQAEKIESALELLLRADPEKFMAFYGELADVAPDPQPYANPRQTPEWEAWWERHQTAATATAKEIDRLLEEEWGREWAKSEKRYQLPERIERELEERVRQIPAIAALWEEVGELEQGDEWGDEWEMEPPVWQPAAHALATWDNYLRHSNPSGPILRVTERVRPVLWSWVETALDANAGAGERQRLARRFKQGLGRWWENGWLAERAPALLLNSKSSLLKSICELLEGETAYYYRQRQGEEWVASVWISLLSFFVAAAHPRYDHQSEEWQLSGVETATLHELAERLPDQTANYGVVTSLAQAVAAIEARAQDEAVADEVEAPIESDYDLRFEMNQAHALTPAQLQQIFGEANNISIGDEHHEKAYEKASAKAQQETAKVEDEIIAIPSAQRLARLIESPHPRDPKGTIPRQVYLGLWTRDLKPDQASEMARDLAERAQGPLWERLEAQLEAYRRVEIEAIEPDIEQKLTEREAKEWRRNERAAKRGRIEQDVLDTASFLVEFGGLDARLRAIAMADRPHCRGIRDGWEANLFALLSEFPGGYRYQSFPLAYLNSSDAMMTDGSGQILDSDESWRRWKLDARWDAILEKMETRLESTKEEWQRAHLENLLAAGFYRRDDFTRFERYATRPNAAPPGVAQAALFFDDFEAWRVLLGSLNGWNKWPLVNFWQAQQSDPQRRARALTIVVQTLSKTNAEDAARVMLEWLKPLSPAEFEPHLAQVENALESAVVPIKKWAMSVLSGLPKADFDRELAAQTASEALWSENVGLAKDAAKFLATLALADENIAELAWSGLEDATALENVGVCEAVFRALVKIKSKRKTMELSDAAREKLELLREAQTERFGKFAAKLG